MYEDNLDYASTRLSGTFIQHKGKVLYVQKVRLDNKGVPSVYVNDHKDDEFYVALKDLDHTPIPLGYIPSTSHLFLERMPKRKWKQGIHPENTICLGEREKLEGFPPIQYLQKLLEGVYPPKEQCFVEGGAFSRNFFVNGKTKQLFYKGEVVGSIVDGRIVLIKGKEYMHRRLEKTQ